MRARICLAITAVAAVAWTPGWAACPSSKSRDCVINFGAVPQISEQIVAGEKVTAPPKTRLPEATPAYTGPTIGAAPVVGRAPEVGYRWAIN
jgi:hypothetical protein